MKRTALAASIAAALLITTTGSCLAASATTSKAPASSSIRPAKAATSASVQPANAKAATADARPKVSANRKTTAAAPNGPAEDSAARRTIPSRPTFAASLPAPVNEKAITAVRFRLASAFQDPLQRPAPDSTSILGTAEATQEQLVAFIKRRNPKPKLNCTVEDIVRYYFTEGAREGIRGDVALCQALKETGFFGYGGDVSPTQNNFCGLGATGNREKGASFPTAEIGVRAHIQHLKAYASTEAPKTAIVDPRYGLLKANRRDVFGRVSTWTGLNGVWAVPGTHYGQDILRLWKAAQSPDASDASLRLAEEKVAKAPKAVDSYLYRGAVYYARGDYEKAASDFRKGAELDKHADEALYDLALTLTRQGNAKEARKTYDRLLKNRPVLAEASYNSALLALADRDYRTAEKNLAEALRLVPQQADAQNAIAVALIHQRKYKEAWEALEKAATINSANWNVLANQLIFEACLTEGKEKR